MKSPSAKLITCLVNENAWSELYCHIAITSTQPGAVCGGGCKAVKPIRDLLSLSRWSIKIKGCIKREGVEGVCSPGGGKWGRRCSESGHTTPPSLRSLPPFVCQSFHLVCDFQRYVFKSLSKPLMSAGAKTIFTGFRQVIWMWKPSSGIVVK